MLHIPAEIMKTNKSLDIPLNLEAHKAIMNTENGSIHNQGLGTHLPNRPIFTYNGMRIKDPGASAWRRAKKKAGIDIRFHDLRHTWATRCIESGMSPAHVQYLGGWSSPKMMQRYMVLETKELYGKQKLSNIQLLQQQMMHRQSMFHPEKMLFTTKFYHVEKDLKNKSFLLN